MTIKKSYFLLNVMMFCLGATVGRQIGDPYQMRHLAAELADLMLVNLPHWIIFHCGLFPFPEEVPPPHRQESLPMGCLTMLG
jgi:hypothetical protein